MTVDEQIKSLLGDSQHFSVAFDVTCAPEISYTVIGLGAEKREEVTDQWALTGGTEGSFEYTIHGSLSHPEAWKGYSVVFHVNYLDSTDRVSHEANGFLGDGWCQDRSVLLRVYVKPQIARDILDKLFVFNKLQPDNESYIECRLTGLRPGNNFLDGAILYDISHISC